MHHTQVVHYQSTQVIIYSYLKYGTMTKHSQSHVQLTCKWDNLR